VSAHDAHTRTHAACPAATADSAGPGSGPPSLSTVMVMSRGGHSTSSGSQVLPCTCWTPERFGHYGQGDGHGHGSVSRLDCGHADDLLGRVHARGASGPARYGLFRCHGELGADQECSRLLPDRGATCHGKISTCSRR
jgi:hypothetical protein